MAKAVMRMQGSQTNILLETGTNELEIMEFTISGQLFGINVAKVKEIMMYNSVIPMQRSHPMIEGVFKPRDKVLTVVNLAKYLGLTESEAPDKDIFIIASFNKLDFAFHVHTVVGIDRVSWTMMQKPDQIIYGGDEGVATAIAEYQDRLITILDFEKIVMDISSLETFQNADMRSLGDRKDVNTPIMVVEDSMLLSNMIEECLKNAGYVNTIKFNNGKEAWAYLQEIKNTGSLFSKVACVLTDIEMPQMDGHHLTKLIKTDIFLKKIPVMVFSSLIDESMRLRGESLGADAHLSKPQIGNLVATLDRLIL